MEGLECENRGQIAGQDTKFGKKTIFAAFMVGMLVGTLGLAAASSLGPAMLSTRKFVAPVGARPRVSATQGLRSASPIMSDGLDALSEALKLDPEAALDKAGSDFCSRRNALGRAAAAAAAMIGAPALVSAAATVKMGSDEGKLVFEPSEITACKGDTVTWTVNKAGPHNVVFDEDNCPAGFDAEAASMEELLGTPGETYSYKFEMTGSFKYRCLPHAGAGMAGNVEVK
jgi:plastocyanin